MLYKTAFFCYNMCQFEGVAKNGKNTVDAKYEATQKILQHIVDKFELNLLYVSKVTGQNYSHITYIYNPVKKNGKWKVFPLGYEEDYIQKDYNDSAKRVFEKGEMVIRHTLKTRSGSHITSMVPVYDSNQNIVAVLGFQKSIQEFVNARYSFVILVLIVEIVFAVIFIVLFSLFFNLNIIKPILLLTQEAQRFSASSKKQKPVSSVISIKNKDEIGTLASTLMQMEAEICTNFDELAKITSSFEKPHYQHW